MMLQSSANTYSSLDTSCVSQEILEKIFMIEQDMWARGIGEYLKCDDCEKIFSKSDIYESSKYSSFAGNIRNKTVMEIENILFGGKTPHCNACSGSTSHVFAQEGYMSEITARYSRSESFLTLAHNSEGEIIGFMDGYISSLEDIYHSEFASHFRPELVDAIRNKYKIGKGEQLLTVSSLGCDAAHASLGTTFGVIQKFFQDMDPRYDEISGIIESIIGSSTYAIFTIMGAHQLGVGNSSQRSYKNQRNTDFETDILFQASVVEHYKKRFHVRARDVVTFLKEFQE